MKGWRGEGVPSSSRGDTQLSPLPPVWHDAAAPDTCAGALASWELGGKPCPSAAPYHHDGPDAEEAPAARRGASPMAEILARMSQARVRPGTGSPRPIEREKKVKPPQQALARDVKAGNFRGVMFASV